MIKKTTLVTDKKLSLKLKESFFIYVNYFKVSHAKAISVNLVVSKFTYLLSTIFPPNFL